LLSRGGDVGIDGRVGDEGVDPERARVTGWCLSCQRIERRIHST